MLVFDHIAIAAGRLEDGVAMVESALGVTMAGGGAHPLMGTHNRLLGLGDIYLEVIAIDPAAPSPGRPRWFDLDRFTGAPRIANWVAGCDDIAAELAASPPGAGVETPVARGDFRWRMGIPADGRLPFDGAFPGLIRWDGPHPAPLLPDAGVRLTRLEIAHPEAAALRAALSGRIADPRIAIAEGPAKALRATFDTPKGQRVIG